MLRYILFCSVALACGFVREGTAFASGPVLFFSDITSGPKVGLGDGKGSGAIVTVWGHGLGAAQGTGTVHIGAREAAHVYYWGNADGSKLAGPADLYAMNKMQTISFSIPAEAPDGDVQIGVRVNGTESNLLPFTVRAGNIFHVRTSGNDAGTGSWSDPWAHMDYVGSGGGGRVTPGSIIYVGDGVREVDGLNIKYTSGTPALPISLIAYPGATVIAEGAYGIGNWSAAADYWNYAKLVVRTLGTGISANAGMRAVGNEITNLPGGCADGQSGAISGANKSGNDVVGGIKALGNYIHDFGCDTTSKLHHVFYISNRAGFASESFELGWNYLRDNKAHHGLHVYDEGICGDFRGTMRVHDNVVMNQVGVCVDISAGGTTDPCFTMPVEIYNNVFVNCGLETASCTGGHNTAISITRTNNRSQVKFYNNTTYGYGVPGNGAYLFVPGTFGGSWEYVNNVVVDTNNLPYEGDLLKAPSVKGGNMWHSLRGSKAPPSWDDMPLTGDPQFVSPAAADFRLRTVSPGKDTGKSSVSSVLNRDLLGNQRSGYFDIGAYEHVIEPPQLRFAP